MSRIIGALLCLAGFHKWGMWRPPSFFWPNGHRICLRFDCFGTQEHRPADREGGER